MNYCIRYINLPCTVKGFTVQDENSFYNVYINANLSDDEQNEAVLHELSHIENDDFEKLDENLNVIENEVIINVKNNIIKVFV